MNWLSGKLPGILPWIWIPPLRAGGRTCGINRPLLCGVSFPVSPGFPYPKFNLKFQKKINKNELIKKNNKKFIKIHN